MDSKVIKISWPYSDEYIELKWDHHNKLQEVTATRGFWKKQNALVKYNTSSTIKKDANGWVLYIHYQRENNQHIDPNDSYWGYSQIEIPDNAPSGSVRWNDSDDISHNEILNWKLVSSGLFKEKKPVKTTKTEREQAYFRSILLEMDKCCAITGETTISTLEAAHIIPSSHGGAEVKENGIILRSDIHRLFDAGLFKLDPSGEIIILSDDLSDNYKTLLQNTNRIQQSIVNRIRSALEFVRPQSSN